MNFQQFQAILGGNKLWYVRDGKMYVLVSKKESTVIGIQVQQLDVGKKLQIEKSTTEHKTDGQTDNPVKPP